MNKIIIAIAVMIVPMVVKSQSSIEGHISYGTYLMSDFKSVLKNNVEIIGNNTVVVYNFPPYWGYEIGYKYKFRNVLYEFDMLFGLVGSYNSTGGRLSAKDYSGETLQDMLVNVIVVGPNVRFIESGEKKLKMGFEFATLVGVTTLKNKFLLTVGNVSDSEISTLTYLSTLFDTYWVTEYSLNKNLSLVSRLGYQIDVGLIRSYDEPTYSLNSGRRMQPDWTGLRGSVGVSCSF